MSADESASGDTYAVCWNGGQRATINGHDAAEFEAVYQGKARLTFNAAPDCPPSSAKAYRMSIDPHNGSSTGPPASNVVVVENGVGRLVLDYTPPGNGAKSMVFLRMHFAPEAPGYGYGIDSGKPVIRNDPGIQPSPLLVGILAAVAGAILGGIIVGRWLRKRQARPTPP
jgi:hypothetical protein